MVEVRSLMSNSYDRYVGTAPDQTPTFGNIPTLLKVKSELLERDDALRLVMRYLASITVIVLVHVMLVGTQGGASVVTKRWYWHLLVIEIVFEEVVFGFMVC